MTDVVQVGFEHLVHRSRRLTEAFTLLFRFVRTFLEAINRRLQVVDALPQFGGGRVLPFQMLRGNVARPAPTFGGVDEHLTEALQVAGVR